VADVQQDKPLTEEEKAALRFFDTPLVRRASAGLPIPAWEVAHGLLARGLIEWRPVTSMAKMRFTTLVGRLALQAAEVACPSSR
jgi:hypothetical protein